MASNVVGAGHAPLGCWRERVNSRRHRGVIAMDHAGVSAGNEANICQADVVGSVL